MTDIYYHYRDGSSRIAQHVPYRAVPARSLDEWSMRRKAELIKTLYQSAVLHVLPAWGKPTNFQVETINGQRVLVVSYANGAALHVSIDHHEPHVNYKQPPAKPTRPNGNGLMLPHQQ